MVTAYIKCSIMERKEFLNIKNILLKTIINKATNVYGLYVTLQVHNGKSRTEKTLAIFLSSTLILNGSKTKKKKKKKKNFHKKKKFIK